MQLPNNDIIKKGKAVGKTLLNKPKSLALSGKKAFQPRRLKIPSFKRQASPVSRPVESSLGSASAVGRQIPETEKSNETPSPKQQFALGGRQSQSSWQLSGMEEREIGGTMREQKNKSQKRNITESSNLPEITGGGLSEMDNTKEKEENPEEEMSFDLGQGQENLASDLMRREKKTAWEKFNESENREIYGKTANLALSLVEERYIRATITAMELAFLIRQKIDKKRFEGGVFIFVLVVAVIKDVSDMPFGGSLSWVTNIIFWIVLNYVLFLKLPTIKKIILKRLFWPIVMESLLGISIFPIYTISIIWLRLRTEKEKRDLQEQLDELEGRIK